MATVEALATETLGKFSGVNNNFYGKKHSLKTRILMKKNHKGMTGKSQSENQKRIISEIFKGKPNPHNEKWKNAMRGRKLSEEHKINLRIARGGDGKDNGKVYKHYKTFQYKEWRKSVFERDNYTCQKCGKKSGNGKTVVIHPHHIKSFTYYPELRYFVDNGITLCVPCHHQTHWGH